MSESSSGAPPPPNSADDPQNPRSTRESQRDPMWTIAELLQWTEKRFAQSGIETPRVDAEHLLARALGCARVELYVRSQDVVDSGAKSRFRALVRRRLGREPVAYIEGVRGFHALGLELRVDPRVLIPRPETEHLVDWLLEELPDSGGSVVDVGTGSGAIALAIKHARPEVSVTGVDVSPDALEVATSNAVQSELDVEFHCSDLLTDVPAVEGGWVAVAANLPYVASPDFEQLSPEVLSEPRLALDGGPDGLVLVRRLVEQVARPGVLAAGGAVYLEIGAGQAQRTAEVLVDAGFSSVATRNDYGGIPRIVRGIRGGTQ